MATRGAEGPQEATQTRPGLPKRHLIGGSEPPCCSASGPHLRQSAGAGRRTQHSNPLLTQVIPLGIVEFNCDGVDAPGLRDPLDQHLLRTDAGDLILDNKVDAVLPWHDVKYEFIKRESSRSAEWLFLEREERTDMIAMAR